MRRAKRSRTNKTLSTRSERPITVSAGGGRLLSKRQWKNKLWNDTISNQKFKTLITGTTTFATPASTSQQTVSVFDIFDAANPFWTVSGGLQVVNLGTAAPTLTPSKIVIRGGVMYVTISLDPAATQDVRIRIQWVYPKQQRARFNSTTTTNVPINDWTTNAAASSVAIGSRMQIIGDYEQYWWNPISDKEILMKPGDSFEARQRIKCKRVDSESVINGFAQFPRIFVYSSNVFTATAQTLRVISGYDMSFCVQDA